MKEISIQKNFETFTRPIIRQKQGTETSQPSFAHTLRKALTDVNRVQMQADQAIQELAAGNRKDIHQTMIALEKAEISFQLMMQVRNKIMAAYEEIMRMQV